MLEGRNRQATPSYACVRSEYATYEFVEQLVLKVGVVRAGFDVCLWYDKVSLQRLYLAPAESHSNITLREQRRRADPFRRTDVASGRARAPVKSLTSRQGHFLGV